MSIGWVDRQQERVVPSSTTCVTSHMRRLVPHSVTKKKLPQMHAICMHWICCVWSYLTAVVYLECVKGAWGGKGRKSSPVESRGAPDVEAFLLMNVKMLIFWKKKLVKRPRIPSSKLGSTERGKAGTSPPPPPNTLLVDEDFYLFRCNHWHSMPCDWQEYEVRELLAQCEASELDLQQQQQQLPTMPSLVPSISAARSPVDNQTSRRSKVLSVQSRRHS